MQERRKTKRNAIFNLYTRHNLQPNVSDWVIFFLNDEAIVTACIHEIKNFFILILMLTFCCFVWETSLRWMTRKRWKDQQAGNDAWFSRNHVCKHRIYVCAHIHTQNEENKSFSNDVMCMCFTLYSNDKLQFQFFSFISIYSNNNNKAI